jgi:hypothetical protein
MRTRDVLRHAKRDGITAGKDAASWVFDGNTTDYTYRAVLKGLDDGDPAILDSLNPPNLSGEWADSETPYTLAERYGIDETRDPDGSLLDDVCTAWEEAANDAFYSEVERVCRFHVQEDK